MKISTAIFALCASIVFATFAQPAHSDPGRAGTVHCAGHILNADGSPAAGANVTLYAMKSASELSKTLHATADQSGAFVFDFDATDGRPAALYVAAASGIAVCRAWNVSGMSANPIALSPPTSVRVRVTDDAGSPVVRARVYPAVLEVADGHSAACVFGTPEVVPQWTVQTDGDGWATLAGLPQGSQMAVAIDDPKYANSYKSLGRVSLPIALAMAPQTSDQTVSIARAGSISGRLVCAADENAAAGQRVEASSTDSPGRTYATSDSDGRFELTGLVPGVYNVIFSGSATTSADWTAVAHEDVVVKPGATEEGVDLSLVRGALIEGLVTDKNTGEPAAGALIRVRGPSNPHVGLLVKTDDKGIYRARVPAGSQTVMAPMVVAHLNQDDVKVVDVKDGETKTVDLVVDRPQPRRLFAVEGVVLDERGNPVAGAAVDTFSENGPYSGSYAHLKTDVRGQFALNSPLGLASGDMLLAHSEDEATPVPIVVKSGVTHYVLNLSSGAFATLRGRVQDQDGKPLGGARVALYRWFGNTGTSDGNQVVTDNEGRYQFNQLYGCWTYGVTASAKGYAYRPGPGHKLQASPGKTTDFDPIVLDIADSYLAGIILDPSGKPLQGAVITSLENPDAHAATDAAGRFRIEGMPRGKTTIRVEAPGQRQTSQQELAPNDDVRITVYSRAELEGQSRKLARAAQEDPSNHGRGDDALALFASAEARAAASGKSVLLVFHASWCPGCILLHKLLEDPQVSAALEPYFVVQEIDLWEHDKNGWENPGGVDLYKKYGDTKGGVPYTVILDKAGNKLADSAPNGKNYGFPQTDQAQFCAMLKSAAPSIQADQLKAVVDGIARIVQEF